MGGDEFVVDIDRVAGRGSDHQALLNGRRFDGGHVFGSCAAGATRRGPRVLRHAGKHKYGSASLDDLTHTISRRGLMPSAPIRNATLGTALRLCPLKLYHRPYFLPSPN